MRVFVDRDGTEWQVWKVVPQLRFFVERRCSDRRTSLAAPRTGVENRRGWDRRQGDILQGWLCFGCKSERRRLYPIPPGWETCSDERLDLLRRVARRVPQLRGDPPEGPPPSGPGPSWNEVPRR